MKEPLTKCELCPRRCSVDRLTGELGFCGAGNVAEVYCFGPHHGEEPPVSGTRGSGTVFFARCTLSCLYCQNHPWSQEGSGRKYSVVELAEVFRSLRIRGCHNWNLVSPTPWLPRIRKALDLLRGEGVSLPVVYNTSGFERVETLSEFRDVADICLVDLRYSRETTAEAGSRGPGYVAAMRAAVRDMWKQAGPLRLDEQGCAISGTICRLLILPGYAEEAVENLSWLAEVIGPEIAVSVMSQYLPAFMAPQAGKPWNRRITRDEYETVCEAVDRLGFTTGWIQGFGNAPPKDLIGFEMPAGDGTGVEPGDKQESTP